MKSKSKIIVSVCQILTSLAVIILCILRLTLKINVIGIIPILIGVLLLTVMLDSVIDFFNKKIKGPRFWAIVVLTLISSGIFLFLGIKNLL